MRDVTDKVFRQVYIEAWRGVVRHADRLAGAWTALVCHSSMLPVWQVRTTLDFITRWPRAAHDGIEQVSRWDLTQAVNIMGDDCETGA